MKSFTINFLPSTNMSSVINLSETVTGITSALPLKRGIDKSNM